MRILVMPACVFACIVMGSTACALILGGDEGIEAAADSGAARDSAPPPEASGIDVDGAVDSGPPVVRREGQVAHYAFEEEVGTVVLDSSGNGYHGTHNASYVKGKKGQALSVKAKEGARIAGNWTWGEGNADYTVEYWFYRLIVDGDWVTVFHKSDQDGGNCCASWQRSPAHFFRPGTLIHTSGVATVTEPNAVFDSPPLPLSQWIHIATVHQGSQYVIYVDGIQAAIGTLPSPTVGGPGILYIGSDTHYSSMTGYIDEVRIFSRALTPAEINADIREP